MSLVTSKAVLEAINPQTLRQDKEVSNDRWDGVQEEANDLEVQVEPPLHIVDVTEVDKQISPALRIHALAVAEVSVMSSWHALRPWECIDWNYLKQRDSQMQRGEELKVVREQAMSELNELTPQSCLDDIRVSVISFQEYLIARGLTWVEGGFCIDRVEDIEDEMDVQFYKPNQSTFMLWSIKLAGPSPVIRAPIDGFEGRRLARLVDTYPASGAIPDFEPEMQLSDLVTNQQVVAKPMEIEAVMHDVALAQERTPDLEMVQIVKEFGQDEAYLLAMDLGEELSCFQLSDLLLAEDAPHHINDKDNPVLEAAMDVSVDLAAAQTQPHTQAVEGENHPT